MKKLLQINPVIRENTSTGRIMRELGDLVLSAGWESYIAYSGARDGIRSHSSKLIPVGNRFDLLCHWLATRLFDAHGLVSRRPTRKLIRRIREIDPDVIHIHNVHGYFLNYPLLCDYLKESGKPVIWTAHDCWLYTGHCYHYSTIGCDRWKTECHDCPNKKRFPASYGLDRSRRNYIEKKRYFSTLPSLTLVAVSRWMKGELAQSFLSKMPCHVIANGIDMNVFKPCETDGLYEGYGITRPCYFLAVAAIWLPEKGLKDLASLAGLLKEDEQLVLVGKLTAQQKASLPQSVITIARTADVCALAKLYSAATALVNPTWQDNYPTVNLESIACGTPVVTYRTGGSGESVTPETGFIVEQGDVEGMADRLHAIRRQDRAAWRSSCRNYALEHFDKNKAFQAYLDLYKLCVTD